MSAPDSGIPRNLLGSAECIAVIPGEKQFAFLVGGQYGKGLVTCRTAHGWSAPVFPTAVVGSFGLQSSAAHQEPEKENIHGKSD